MAKAEHTTSATSLVRLARGCKTRCYRTPTACSAETRRHIRCIRNATALKQFLQTLLPCACTKAFLLLVRKSLPLLIHPAELPAMLLADAFQPLGILSMPFVRYQSLHMMCIVDLAVDLSFLVLHVANFV